MAFGTDPAALGGEIGAEPGSPSGSLGGGYSGMDFGLGDSGERVLDIPAGMVPPTGFAFDRPGLFDLGARLQDPRTAGVTLAGLLTAGAPMGFGTLAMAAQALNDRYFGGRARADVDQNIGGPGGSFEEMLRAVGSPDLERLLAGFRGLPGAFEAASPATPPVTALPLLMAPAAPSLPPLAPQLSGASFGGAPGLGAGFNLF